MVAKIVHQTSAMFDKAQGDPCLVNLNSTGMQIACPIITDNGVSAPYCFVVSIFRSPVVGPTVDTGNKQNNLRTSEFNDPDGDAHSADNLHHQSYHPDRLKEEMTTLGASIQTTSNQELRKQHSMNKVAARLGDHFDSERSPNDKCGNISHDASVASKSKVRNKWTLTSPMKKSASKKKVDGQDPLEGKDIFALRNISKNNLDLNLFFVYSEFPSTSKPYNSGYDKSFTSSSI